MNGQIFDIQRFCIHDGPGIRTVVFMKGCPLHCAWCHNPESQSMRGEVMFYEEKCICCGRCVQLCKNRCHTVENGVHVFERSRCGGCFECIGVGCDALEAVGQKISSDEVLSEVIRDKVFYRNSGGGVTLSGGEPLMQAGFSAEILKKAKENGIHTAVETCGFAAAEKIGQISEYSDLWLYDYKETNPKRHKEFIGADNELIINNLQLLNEMRKKVILRCPIIPGYNDRSEHFDGICGIANRMENILRVEIEPYHTLGKEKYAALARKPIDVEENGKEYTEKIRSYMQLKTDKPVVIA